MVFRYGVFAEYGTGAPLRRASPISSSNRKYARSGPSKSSTASRESSHSLVSAGSRSLGICTVLPPSSPVGGRVVDRCVPPAGVLVTLAATSRLSGGAVAPVLRAHRHQIGRA